MRPAERIQRVFDAVRDAERILSTARGELRDLERELMQGVEATPRDLVTLARKLRCGVMFTYHGGSHPGQKRVAMPTEDDPAGVDNSSSWLGVDTLAGGDLRRFTYSKMSDVELAAWEPPEG